MPPAFSTIVGHAVSQPAETNPAATDTQFQSSERPFAMTTGSDILIRLHVVDQQEVKGTILPEDLDTSSAFASSSVNTKHVASTTKSIATTWLRVPTKISSSPIKDSVSLAGTNEFAFKTMAASVSLSETPSVSISHAPISTLLTESIQGWTSRLSVEQPTRTPTPVPASGRASDLPISSALLYVLMALLAMAVWFAVIVARINWSNTSPSKGGSRFPSRFPSRNGKERGGTQETKDNNLHSALHDNVRPDNPPTPSSQLHQTSRIHTRTLNPRSTSYTPQPPTTTTSPSPPQTPRPSSHPDFPPQATTSSSTYTTPTTTPLQPHFPTPTFLPQTLRHRTHAPPPLTITPHPQLHTSTALDLEDQTPLPTPRFGKLRPAGASREGSVVEQGDRAGIPRMGDSRWVAGLVDRVGEKFVRYTRGEESYQGSGLPVNKW